MNKGVPNWIIDSVGEEKSRGGDGGEVEVRRQRRKCSVGAGIMIKNSWFLHDFHGSASGGE